MKEVCDERVQKMFLAIRIIYCQQGSQIDNVEYYHFEQIMGNNTVFGRMGSIHRSVRSFLLDFLVFLGHWIMAKML